MVLPPRVLLEVVEGPRARLVGRAHRGGRDTAPHDEHLAQQHLENLSDTIAPGAVQRLTRAQAEPPADGLEPLAECLWKESVASRPDASHDAPFEPGEFRRWDAARHTSPSIKGQEKIKTCTSADVPAAWFARGRGASRRQDSDHETTSAARPELHLGADQKGR